jgi:hypothetical protein
MRNIQISQYYGFKRRDSAVGIATSRWSDDRGVGVRLLEGSRIFTSSRRPERLWGPPSLLYNGYPGVKRPGREADYSQQVPRSRKYGSIHPLHPYVFKEWCLIS